jgi:hypothetical protein
MENNDKRTRPGLIRPPLLTSHPDDAGDPAAVAADFQTVDLMNGLPAGFDSGTSHWSMGHVD